MWNESKTKGFSLVELLIVVGIILILASLAIPNFMRARRSANEASAVGSLKAIASGQLVYRHTQGVYADLNKLNQDTVIDSVLGSGSKSGYVFDSAAGSAPDLQFTATAEPAVSTGWTATGARFFYVDETQVIRFKVTGPADSTSSPLD